MNTTQLAAATENDYLFRVDARREQMLRELASDLADLVSSGDMTEQEANEWYSSKADQWKNGVN